VKFPGLFLISTVMCLPIAAQATLGGTVSSVSSNQTSMKAVLATSTVASSYTDNVITQGNGVVVHEYTNSNGKVFMVTWHGPFKPDLEELLGTYFSDYVEARESRTGVQLNLSQIHSSSSSLVVRSGGHRGAFAGRAYLPSLVPSDVTAEDLE